MTFACSYQDGPTARTMFYIPAGGKLGYTMREKAT